MATDEEVGIEIWNRAAMGGGGGCPREGDIALRDLLLAHGYVMNGGVIHAAQALSSEELRAACAGYRYLGFAPAAELLESVLLHGRRDERALDEAYGEHIPSDSTLDVAFNEHRRRYPDSYAPAKGILRSHQRMSGDRCCDHVRPNDSRGRALTRSFCERTPVIVLYLAWRSRERPRSSLASFERPTGSPVEPCRKSEHDEPRRCDCRL